MEGQPQEQQESLEAMQARHRKEQRDLQGRITSKKKNATKKTRKGVNDECAELERQLKARQEEELAATRGGAAAEGEEGEGEEEETRGENTADGVADQLDSTSLSDARAPPPQPAPEAPTQAPGKKRNRQKERMARRAAEQEAAAEAAEAEAANMTDHRKIEKTYLLKEFQANGLVEKEIQPDGHCLFSAVADQLQQQAIPLGGGGGGETADLPYRATRRRATDYMRAHADDFAPFMEEDFDAYVSKMRTTAEWGGQLELTALARAYGVEIRVLQDGRTETIVPSDGQPEGGGERRRIWLAYYRHGYGLGEHYNSLRKAA